MFSMLVNIHEAKTHLSKLIERVLKGEEIIIGKAGKPVAKLTPYTPKKVKLGVLKGKIEISEDFDEEDEEIIEMFYK